MIFLDYLSYRDHAQRRKESFDTHVWMLETILRQSQERPNDFILYVIAVSFQKMCHRMTNKQFSTPYKACLLRLKQKNFAFVELTKTGDSDRDTSFIKAIPDLAKYATTKIPHLQRTANQPQPIEIYNECTYMEFHLLLCELLTKFSDSLNFLQKLTPGESELENILCALDSVQILGHYLRTMVKSSAIEIHLQTIAPLLDVDTRKSWTPEPDSEEVADVADFQRLKPFSIRKGKPLLPWESYRDWLRLMVHYFDAARVLTSYARSLPKQANTISITILSPPAADKKMLSWTVLLETERFFPTVPGQLSGQDFVKFLKKCYDGVDLPRNDAIREIIKSAKVLKEKLESDLLIPDILTEIDALHQEVTKNCTPVDWVDVISEILALKDYLPRDRPAKMQTIVDMLDALSKDNLFYVSLKKGPLCSGEGARGGYHCEAYIASLLHLSRPSASEQRVNDFEMRLPVNNIQEVLEGIKASHVFMHHLNLCADFNNSIVGLPLECLNDAARYALSCFIC